jgi:hypothetical protein
MNRKYSGVILGLMVAAGLAGCATTQELTSTVKSTVSSITSTVDPAIVSQVPADKREGFAKAEYELKVAEEKLNLAVLKTEYASAQKRIASLEEDLADSFRKEAVTDYDLVKIEAIIKAGLGKSKEDNLKTKAELQSKKLKMQANRITIQNDLDLSKVKADDLAAQVAKKDQIVKGMKFSDGKAGSESQNKK